MLRRDVSSCPEFSGYRLTFVWGGFRRWAKGGEALSTKIEQFMSEDITRSQFLTLEMFKGFNDAYSASIQAQR